MSSALVYYVWQEWLDWELPGLIFFAIVDIGFLIVNIYTDLDNSIEKVKAKVDLLLEDFEENKDSISKLKSGL